MSQYGLETALLRVQNDLLMALDSGCSVFLLMLDLSAAFDTIDHSIMLFTLANRFDIKGKILQWFESYLSCRRQAVVVNTKSSSWYDLPFGVPQGSILGPLLFTLYISPIGDIVRRHNISYHTYADDTQLYLSFRAQDYACMADAKSPMELCVNDIKMWMQSHFLKLNDYKPELLVHSKYRQMPPLPPVVVGNEMIMPTECARNIGVMFDHNMTMDQQITSVCKSAFFHISNIRKIRKYISQHAAEIIVHSLVTSRLDHCNALLCGVPKNFTARIQRIQNCAVCLIVGSSKHDHIHPVLKSLHWLPVKSRIAFKTLVLTLRHVRGYLPSIFKTSSPTVSDLLQSVY